MPDDLCVHLPKLEVLYLFMNELSSYIPSSEIPKEIGNLFSLEILSATNMGLSGQIPTSIFNISSLTAVDLRNNNLSEPATHKWSFLSSLVNCMNLRFIDVSQNPLNGILPTYIGNLSRSLQQLLASDCELQDLSNNKFHGHIPESFGGLISLEFLDLCNNNISGVIPKSLEKLLNLKYFNVSYNRLEGEIPIEGQFRNFSSKSFMKNYALCGPPILQVPPCKSSFHKNSKLIMLRVLRCALPTIAIVVVIITFTIMYRKCKSRSITLPVKEDLLSLKTRRRILYDELSQATEGFGECNFLGSGSFGSVYKGRLSDGMNVAIKVFNLQIEGAFRSFDTECEALRNIVHRNLVKVITCCSNVDFKALVLDFMPNGSLEKWLHSESHFLDILQRINIMIDVASALEYLHAGQPIPVIHCDLKPGNILLDEDMVAHLGDFGIAKLLEEDDFMRQTMTLATIGYMAPEYGSAGIVSVKCDIYSYGILLIETFTKKKPTDEIFSEALTMRHWMKMSISKGMIDIADANLLRRDDEYFIIKANCISSIMELALKCSAELPEDRNNIVDVVTLLKKIKQKFLISIEQVLSSTFIVLCNSKFRCKRRQRLGKKNRAAGYPVNSNLC
ncbi:receptor kinase-like protein Xa21 [Durio zibethinus]|uniref:non-specific serine/threonine protein kinase n=1 Tax=Durio zibethinus TaxID=66656 RepID=A0A6P5Y4Z8_DURZI|nr:receptor kinase-like protein Xa21 [Durio zibethinus]